MLAPSSCDRAFEHSAINAWSISTNALRSESIPSPDRVLMQFSRSKSADCVPATAASNSFFGDIPVFKANDTNSPHPFKSFFSKLFLMRRQSSTCVLLAEAFSIIRADFLRQ